LTAADSPEKVAGMVDAGLAYAQVQRRMSELVGSLSDAELTTPVPACPGWTVQDLVAHHTAVLTEMASGSLAELKDLSRLMDQQTDVQVASDRDAMTARQVAERRGRSIHEILDEWAAATRRITPMLQGEIPFPESVGLVGGVIAVNDVVVHEGDLREALGVEPAPVVHATSLALAGYGFSLDSRLQRAAVPALAFQYDGKQRVFGSGTPAATVSADRTTLVRLLASRLVDDQILALDWRGDPTPYLAIIPEYGPAHPA
jgi:uncharacterized protein (TIGR03083 family)